MRLKVTYWQETNYYADGTINPRAVTRMLFARIEKEEGGIVAELNDCSLAEEMVKRWNESEK